MNEIKDCIDALLAAVQNSEEYQEFEKYRDLLKREPGAYGPCECIQRKQFQTTE